MRGGSVYIMTNRPNGTLYLGVTSDLSRRAWQHRTAAAEGFTKRYGLTRLIWYEHHDDIRVAIQRERTMKHWPRAWKVRLILDMNPDWRCPLRRPRLTRRSSHRHGRPPAGHPPSTVMAGLVPAIHAGRHIPSRSRRNTRPGVDGRDEPGHDD